MEMQEIERLQKSELGKSSTSLPVTAIAAVPGPVTGMTVATKGVLDYLSKQTEVRFFNLAPRKRISGWQWKVYKFWRVLQIRSWLKKQVVVKGSFVYLPANAQRGLVATERQVQLAKSLGYRIALHHHVFSYLSTHDPRMARIQAMMDADDLNIILSDEMQLAFDLLYKARAASLVLNYAYMMRELLESPIAPRSKLTVIGHLSNLTTAKGFDVVLNTFDQLRNQGADVRLVIAGPLVSGKEKQLLEAAMKQHPDRIEYCGPVFGNAKKAFFDGIDVFLMPTRYVNEAQPLVILEAFSRGKPVIAYGRGCIPSLFVGEEGVAVDPQDDFVSVASEAIDQWRKSEEKFARAQRAARTRVEALLSESLEGMRELKQRLCDTEAESQAV